MTTTTMVSMRRATAEDGAGALAIVQNAALWLRERGLPQWRVYLTDEGVRDVLEAVAGTGGKEFYLATVDAKTVGTIMLSWDDLQCWDDRGGDGRAGYVHTLAVTRSMSGQRLGEQMLQWAEQVIQARGRAFARLDCWAGNPKLIDYYLQRGYEIAGLMGGPNGAQLFQKRVRP